MEQISHIEVRRHPIWQREVQRERKVERPRSALTARSLVFSVAGAIVFATILVVAAG